VVVMDGWMDGMDGWMVVVCSYNHRIRRITPAGDVLTLAGTGADAHGSAAVLLAPAGSVAPILLPNSTPTPLPPLTPALPPPAPVSWGYNGQGVVQCPAGIAIDRARNLYVSDAKASVIRKICSATGLLGLGWGWERMAYDMSYDRPSRSLFVSCCAQVW
jgi:hypothetical protein